MDHDLVDVPVVTTEPAARTRFDPQLYHLAWLKRSRQVEPQELLLPRIPRSSLVYHGVALARAITETQGQ